MLMIMNDNGDGENEEEDEEKDTHADHDVNDVNDDDEVGVVVRGGGTTCAWRHSCLLRNSCSCPLLEVLFVRELLWLCHELPLFRNPHHCTASTTS